MAAIESEDERADYNEADDEQDDQDGFTQSYVFDVRTSFQRSIAHFNTKRLAAAAEVSQKQDVLPVPAKDQEPERAPKAAADFIDQMIRLLEQQDKGKELVFVAAAFIKEHPNHPVINATMLDIMRQLNTVLTIGNLERQTSNPQELAKRVIESGICPEHLEQMFGVADEKSLAFCFRNRERLMRLDAMIENCTQMLRRELKVESVKFKAVDEKKVPALVKELESEDNDSPAARRLRDSLVVETLLHKLAASSKDAKSAVAIVSQLAQEARRGNPAGQTACAALLLPQESLHAVCRQYPDIYKKVVEAVVRLTADSTTTESIRKAAAEAFHDINPFGLKEVGVMLALAVDLPDASLSESLDKIAASIRRSVSAEYSLSPALLAMLDLYKRPGMATGNRLATALAEGFAACRYEDAPALEQLRAFLTHIQENICGNGDKGAAAFITALATVYNPVAPAGDKNPFVAAGRLVRALSADTKSMELLSVAAREVGEPIIQEQEHRYNPKDRNSALWLASRHELLATVYQHGKKFENLVAGHRYHGADIMRVDGILAQKASRRHDVFDEMVSALRQTPSQFDLSSSRESLDVKLPKGIIDALETRPERISLTKRQMLQGLEGGAIQGNDVSLLWKNEIPLTSIGIPAPGLNVQLLNPAFKVQTSRDGTAMSLTNVTGIRMLNSEVVRDVTLNLVNGANGFAQLKVEMNFHPFLEVNVPPIPGWPLGKQQIAPPPFNSSFNLDADQATIFYALLKDVQAGQGADQLLRLLPSLLGEQSQMSVAEKLSPMLFNVKGGCRDGDRYSLKLSDKTPICGLPVSAGPLLSFRLQSDSSGKHVFEQVDGLTANVALPSQLLDKLGITSEVKVKKLITEAPDINGDRMVQIELEGPLKSVSFRVGKDGSPKLTGNDFVINAQLAFKGKPLDCMFSVPAQDLKDPGKNIKVELAGDDGAKVEMLKCLGLPQELAEFGRNVVGFERSGENFSISNAADSERTAFGLRFAVNRRINIRVEERDVLGKKSQNISCDGIQLKSLDFTGGAAERLASQLGNLLGDMRGYFPLTVKRLSIVDYDEKHKMICLVETQGAIRGGHFIVDKDNPANLIDGNLVIKNPLPQITPFGKEHDIHIGIKGGKVADPVETGFLFGDEIFGSPFLDVTPLGRLYAAGKWGYRFYDNPGAAVDRVGKSISRTYRDVKDTAGDIVDGVGNVLGKLIP